MKLLHQLNLAFGFLLLVILGASALLIYSLLLQLLINDQRSELRDKGTQWLTSVVEKEGSYTQQDIDQLLRIPTRGGKLEVILLERNKVQYTTLPANTLDKWLEQIKESRKRKSKLIFEGEKDQYVVEYVTVDQGKSGKKQLVLAAPLRGLKNVRYMLGSQMFIVLSLGGIVALILSYIMTQVLVKPLTKVGEQLLRIKERRFEDVELVMAGGEIGDVARNVHQLAQELDRSSRTQKQFFQNGSHELKTPLMSIQGYAEGIRDGVFTGDAAKRGLNVIISESERLKKIVTEMTLLAKLESEEGIYHIESINIKEMLEQITERLGSILQKQNISIHLDDQIDLPRTTSFLGDRDKVIQAFINILSNGIRYANKEIIIRVREEGTWVVFDLIDDGNGIPEDMLPHLFERFVKGKDGGTGLGLAISRAIVQRCMGEIKAQNSPDGGAVFSLYFQKQD